MQAIINGKPTDIPDGSTVGDLLRELGLAGRRIAVELNGEIVPRSQHEKRCIAAGDELEVVHAIGGGAPCLE